jgi:hypothetical protein
MTELLAKSGDKIFVRVFNPKNKEEYSVYRITVAKDAYKGDDGLGDVFLFETTGYEPEEVKS